MSIEDDRDGFFATLRACIEWDETSLAHDQVNFLLSTVDAALKKKIEDQYQINFLITHKDIEDQVKKAKQTKRLSDGMNAAVFRVTREHQFWVDMYMFIHEEFVKNDLLPKKGDKK